MITVSRVWRDVRATDHLNYRASLLSDKVASKIHRVSNVVNLSQSWYVQGPTSVSQTPHPWTLTSSTRNC